MTARRLLSAVLVATALLPAACATGPADPGEGPTLGERMRDGDALLRGGDFDGAFLAYTRDLQKSPDDRILHEKMLGARRQAAQFHAQAALAAVKRGDSVGAAEHLERASMLEPDAPVVRRAQELVGTRIAAAARARTLVGEAEFLLDADPEEAERLLVEARTLNPDDDDVLRRLQAATLRAESERASRRAAAAWAAGDRPGTAAALVQARDGKRLVPSARGLALQIARDLMDEARAGDEHTARAARDFAIAAQLDDNAVAEIRDLLAEKLAARAEPLARDGRVATAALLELESRRAGAELPTPNLDGVFERAAVPVVIFPFEDATGGGVDGLRLARALRDRLVADSAAGGIRIRVFGPDGDVEPTAFYAGALHVHGEAARTSVNRTRVGRTQEQVEAVIGHRQEPNPEADALMAELEPVRKELAEAEKKLARAQDRLDRLRALPFRDNPAESRARQGDVAYRTRLAEAEARVEDAKADVQEVQSEESGIRERIRATPQQIDVPITEQRTRTVTTHSIASELAVRLTLTSASGQVTTEEVIGSDRHRESVAAAEPDAGLPEDPDESPDDAEMAARAAQRFVALASGRIRESAEAGAGRFLEQARAAERSGDTAAAVEGYALYLLSTAEIHSPRRADAARAIQELSGIVVPLRTGYRGDEP